MYLREPLQGVLDCGSCVIQPDYEGKVMYHFPDGFLTRL